MTNQQRSFSSPNRWGLDFISPKSWCLMSGLVLLWLLMLHPGRSLAQTPTIPPWMNPLQSAGALHPQDYPDLCVQMNKIPEIDNGVINLSTCNGTNSQIWVLYADNTLRPADYPSLCMTLNEIDVANSEQLYVALCNGSNSQKWNGNGNHNLYLQAYPDYCVGLYGSQRSGGEPIYLLPCDSSSSQLWNVSAAQIIPTPTNTPTPTLTPVPTNTPTPTPWIVPLVRGGTLKPQDHPNFCLNLPNNQARDGALINLWTCNGSNSQIWVRYADNTLRPVDHPTFCLIAGNRAESRWDFYLSTCNVGGLTFQDWQSTTDHSLYTYALCLTLPNNAASDGAPVSIALCDGSNGQKWNATFAQASPTATPPPTPTSLPTPTPLPPNVRTVVAWGSNRAGANSAPAGLLAIAVASGGHHSLALKSDGTVATWGCGGTYNYGQCTIPAGLSGVKAVGAGLFHSLAVKADGTVVAWGCGAETNKGQCTVPVSVSGVISVTGGFVHSLGLKADGTVVAWGCKWASSTFGQCTVPAGLSGVVAIAAGDFHSLALKSDGTVAAWGRNNAGQIKVPAGLSSVVAIAAGHYHSLALKSDGTVVAWGCEVQFNHGQCAVPAGLGGVKALAGGFAHSFALKNDGTVVSWGCAGTANVGQCTIPAGLSGVTAISGGGLHSVALALVSSAGGAAGGAVVAADASVAANESLFIMPMDELLAITLSVPLSEPAVVTATLPITTGDANAPAAPDASQQNQRLFLPLITNLAGAALGSPGAVTGVVVVIVVGGLVWRSRRSRRNR